MPKHKPTGLPASASKSAPDASGAAPSEKTKFQKFQYRTVPRSDIQNLPCNPRIISDYARKQLRKKIEKVGCVEPLVWNQATGHLIGGHQRLRILDDLEGRTDYQLGVAAVDLPEKAEQELAVFLNNTQAQGHFDKDKFIELMETAAPGISIEEMGFTRNDLMIEFNLETLDAIPGLALAPAPPKSSAARPPAAAPGPDTPAGPLDPAGASSRETVAAATDPVAAEIARIKQAKKDWRKNSDNAPEADADYYLMVAFPSVDAKLAWLQAHQFAQDTLYLNAAEVFPETPAKE